MLNHGSNWMHACVTSVQSLRKILANMELLKNAVQRTDYVILLRIVLLRSKSFHCEKFFLGNPGGMEQLWKSSCTVDSFH